MTKSKEHWECKGYGSHHGWRNGRHWFACSACRWHHSEPSPVIGQNKLKGTVAILPSKQTGV